MDEFNRFMWDKFIIEYDEKHERFIELSSERIVNEFEMVGYMIEFLRLKEYRSLIKVNHKTNEGLRIKLMRLIQK